MKPDGRRYPVLLRAAQYVRENPPLNYNMGAAAIGNAATQAQADDCYARWGYTFRGVFFAEKGFAGWFADPGIDPNAGTKWALKR